MGSVMGMRRVRFVAMTRDTSLNGLVGYVIEERTDTFVLQVAGRKLGEDCTWLQVEKGKVELMPPEPIPVLVARIARYITLTVQAAERTAHGVIDGAVEPAVHCALVAFRAATFEVFPPAFIAETMAPWLQEGPLAEVGAEFIDTYNDLLIYYKLVYHQYNPTWSPQTALPQGIQPVGLNLVQMASATVEYLRDIVRTRRPHPRRFRPLEVPSAAPPAA